jgi:MoaA/NifB/PqqE/SkfB family radical SAM enzyme
MITNGWFLTPEIARALFAAGMVEISVSVDYADSQRHDAQRGMAGAFARAIEALRTLQANRTHPEQRVNLISVIMEDNLPDVGPLIQLCEKIGITYLVTLYSHNRGRKPAKSIPADASQKLLQLKRNHRSFVALCGYLERFTEAMDRGGIGPCYGGRNFCNIDSQGNVTFCIDRLGDSAGNILTDDMAAIEAKLMEQFRKNDCRDCWTSCRGCIETLMYGRQPIRNLLDYYCMTRPVALAC